MPHPLPSALQILHPVVGSTLIAVPITDLEASLLEGGREAPRTWLFNRVKIRTSSSLLLKRWMLKRKVAGNGNALPDDSLCLSGLTAHHWHVLPLDLLAITSFSSLHHIWLYLHCSVPSPSSISCSFTTSPLSINVYLSYEHPLISPLTPLAPSSLINTLYVDVDEVTNTDRTNVSLFNLLNCSQQVD